MNKYYTYSHCKPDGSIFYIGKGMGDRVFSKDNRNIHWKRTVAKYGYEPQILAHWDTEEEAFSHEKLLISCFKDMGIKLVNLTPGGEGSAGYKWTDEQKANFDISGSKNGMFGKKHSEETKCKISKKAKGRKISEEAKYKISAKLKNRQFSESHLEKLKIASTGNKNGIGNKGNTKCVGGLNWNAKKCMVDGVIYNSLADARKALNLTKMQLNYRLKIAKYSTYQYF